MTEDYPEEGVESINRSIDRVNKKRETLIKIRDKLESLETKASVYIFNPDDSKQFEVSIKSEEIHPEMVYIATKRKYITGDKTRNLEIPYDFEEEVYKLKKTFKL